jgi:predicted transcriptional regulator
MLYQLPNGKVINLDVSDVLNMTDADIQYLLSVNAGEYIISPFQHSAINTTEKKALEDVESNDEETEIETYFEEYFPDEFPDIPDDINMDFDDM